MKNILFCIAACSLLMSSRLDSQSTLKIPYIQENICPFEFGCDFSLWVTRTRLEAFKREGDTSKVAFVVNPYEAFTVHKANMHIEKPGMVIVTKQFDKFQRGDTVYVLSYTGEGTYDMWYQGHEYNLERFWHEDSLPQYEGVLLDPPRMSWWLMIELKNGKRGWIRLINRSDGGVRFDEDIDMGKTNKKD